MEKPKEFSIRKTMDFSIKEDPKGFLIKEDNLRHLEVIL